MPGPLSKLAIFGVWLTAMAAYVLQAEWLFEVACVGALALCWRWYRAKVSRDEKAEEAA